MYIYMYIYIIHIYIYIYIYIDGLEKKEAGCKIQLSNAAKLIGGLGGEETRWRDTVVYLTNAFDNILGDIIIHVS
jgi:hypothetical protein